MRNHPSNVPHTTLSASHAPYLYRRILLASLATSIGGIIAFIRWTLPSLPSQPLSQGSFVPYVLACIPTFFTLLIIMLGFIVWWHTFDRIRSITGALPAQERVHTQKFHSVNRQPPRPRRTSAEELQARRRQQLYAGRIYKGKAHTTDLEKLQSSFAQSSIPAQKEIPLSNIADTPPPSPAIREEEEKITPADLPAISTGNTLAEPIAILAESAMASSSFLTEAIPEIRSPLKIYLLKEMVVEVQNAEGIKRTIQLKRKRREDGRYIERELLAYMAASKGQPVARDKLLEAVFGYGLSEQRYNPTNLTNQFNKCTQFLRRDINQIASELGLPELTIISNNRDEWRLLTDECQVVDLHEVERLSLMLEKVSSEEVLTPHIQESCQALIEIYKGDFLENYIEDTVRDGGDQWVDNWIRAPYTTYRDYYFSALWYRAEFWRVKADLSSNTSAAGKTLQHSWYDRAAQLYRDYALGIPTAFTHESAMLFDLKARQRISPGERALRASLDMYTATKNTQAGDTTYLTFAKRMEMMTQGRWKPRADTIEAWRNVREQTKSHRFSPRVVPHEEKELS